MLIPEVARSTSPSVWPSSAHAVTLVTEFGGDHCGQILASVLSAKGVEVSRHRHVTSIAIAIQQRDPRVALLASLKCPAVIVGTPDDTARLPYVDFDKTLAGQLCAEHLLELGYRRVGYIGQAAETFKRGVAYAVHARDAALRTLRAGRAIASWSPCDGSPAGVSRALDALLSKTSQLSGLIVYNERALPLIIDGLRVGRPEQRRAPAKINPRASDQRK